MQHNNGRRNNNNNRNRFKNNNQKRRFGGGGSGNGFDDESQNISMQQRKNFANKRDQYLAKAKECLSSGERVEAENYFQHADHCFRMMNLGLKDGARFDPQRMNIQYPHQQNHHGHDNHEQVNGAEGEHHLQPVQAEVAQPNEQGEDASISSLPFMQSPIDLNDEPRVIE